MNRRMTEEQAKKTFERALKMEQEFGEYFTGNVDSLMSIAFQQKSNLILIIIVLSYFHERSSYTRRHHRRFVYQSEKCHLVAVRTNHMGSVERESMTNGHNDMDTAAACPSSTSFQIKHESLSNKTQQKLKKKKQKANNKRL